MVRIAQKIAYFFFCLHGDSNLLTRILWWLIEEILFYAVLGGAGMGLVIFAESDNAIIHILLKAAGVILFIFANILVFEYFAISW